jgi:hypothetical protein
MSYGRIHADGGPVYLPVHPATFAWMRRRRQEWHGVIFFDEPWWKMRRTFMARHAWRCFRYGMRR